MMCTRIRMPDGSTGIVCQRRPPRKRCASCHQLAGLECDGCDKPLCAPCSVSPGPQVLPDSTTSLDFCPTCCRPVFVEWCAGPGAAYKVPKPGITPDTHRMLRRAAFRKWATEHPEKFDALRKAA